MIIVCKQNNRWRNVYTELNMLTGYKFIVADISSTMEANAGIIVQREENIRQTLMWIDIIL